MTAVEFIEPAVENVVKPGTVMAAVKGLTLAVNGSIADAGAGATAQVALYTGDTSDEGLLEAAGTPASVTETGQCAFRHDFPA